MFGKISTLINYMKIWDVYIVKRFPSAKISLWGMGFSYLAIYFAMQRMILSHRYSSLKRNRTMKKQDWYKCPISRYWSFNPCYVKAN